MTEDRIELATKDGRLPVFVSHPDAGGPCPAVVLYMDMYGVREALYEIARYVAAIGYCCAVPDLYYRQGRVRYDFRDDRNRVLSTHRLGPGLRDAIIAESRKLTDEMVLADTGVLLDYLCDGVRARPDAVGVFGYCMGGRHAILAAARYPGRLAAAACIHGTNLVTDKADSPHRLADRLRGELYCGFGADDPYARPETIAAFGAALSEARVRYEYAVHLGAGHGMRCPTATSTTLGPPRATGR